MEIPDFAQFAEQFKKTSYYKAYTDPAMAPRIEDVKAKLAEEVKKNEDELLSMIFETKTLPTGRVAFGLLTEPGKDVSEPQPVVFAEWGQTKDTVRDAVDKVFAEGMEEGERKTTEEYRGVTIVSVVNESNDDVSPGYCFIDDCLIASTHTGLLKSVIAQIKGAGGASLADDADYNSAIKAVGPYHDFNFYANLRELKKQIIAEDPSGQFKALSGSLGFDNVVSFSMAGGIARGPGNGSAGKGFLRIDGEKKGICKMLELDSTSLSIPAFAPPDFYSATYLNFNFKKAFDALGQIITAISPQMAALLYMPLVPASPDGQPGLTVKADIIDHLGSQLLSFRSLDKSAATATAENVETIVALATSNRPALERSLSRLHGLFSQGKPAASRQLLGHTIYTIDLTAFLPFLPGAGGGIQNFGEAPATPMPIMPKLAFTVTDTHVIIGLETRVEKAVRTLSAAGGSSQPPKWYQTARAAIPDVVGLAAFQDDVTVMQVLWETLKKAPKGESSGESSEGSVGVSFTPVGVDLSRGGLDFLNFELLPDFEAVRKHFGISTLYGIAREDGFFFEAEYLSPD
ncbi:MAG: DUF3352 domain-containing protein [Planctomycetota bacterium]|jgi:hypothetical protein